MSTLNKLQLKLFEIQSNDLWFEESKLFQKGISRIAGIDEAGRGPLAGPVIAAAVTSTRKIEIIGVKDSKQLAEKERLLLKEKIENNKELKIGIGEATPFEIDNYNILQASLLAFSRAVKNLKNKPEYCLLDGNCISPWIKQPQKAIIKGDSRSFLIAAASIIAKETRDNIMKKYDKIWPEYGFGKHKGYPTKEHRQAIKKHGICEIHRKSFEPIKSMLN